MPQEHTLKIVARMRSDFADKFGIPRQSGLVPALEARVVFEPEYRDPEALRGLEGFSHIWLLWEFSQARRETWSPTVRSPTRHKHTSREKQSKTRAPHRGRSCPTSHWPTLVNRVAMLMEKLRKRVRIVVKRKNGVKVKPRRGNFAALQTGVSHGGGQKMPSNVQNLPVSKFRPAQTKTSTLSPPRCSQHCNSADR